MNLREGTRRLALLFVMGNMNSPCAPGHRQ
jgi:hypothetical protein